MPRFTRRNPDSIEAIQFTGHNAEDVVAWERALDGDRAFRRIGAEGSNLFVRAPGCVMTALAGDWIIRESNGIYWPCKEHDFEENFKPAE